LCGEGNLKHLLILFTAAFLFCGAEWAAAQSADETDVALDSAIVIPGTEGAGQNTGDAGQGREAERGYLLGEGEAAPQSGGAVSSVWVFLRIVIVLALAAAAIYGIVYFLKRKKTGDTPDDTYLKVLTRAPINIKTAAAVIAVGNKAWLVGLSDTGVSLISEIADQETVDAMLLAYSESSVRSNRAAAFNFTDLLRRFAGGRGENLQDVADIPQPLNLQRNRERLKNL
jgi:flagellar protein FliO/FliZ